MKYEIITTDGKKHGVDAIHIIPVAIEFCHLNGYQDTDIISIIRVDQFDAPKEAGKEEVISDGFGSTWLKKCPTCGRNAMRVVRPGDAECGWCVNHPIQEEEKGCNYCTRENTGKCNNCYDFSLFEHR